MAITFRPLGGLGNQLFTYGAALALAKKRRTEVVADLHYLKWDKFRSFELQSFRSQISEVRVSRSFTSRPIRGIDLPLFRTYKDRGKYFQPSTLNQPDHITLDGYFQSWRYFTEVDQELRRQIRTVSSPSHRFLSERARLAALGSWSAVHVRRGDYIDANFGLASEDYYRKAMRIIEEANGEVTFVVFSDDPKAAREMECFKHRKSVLFFSEKPAISPIETLNLMATAPSIVIANSTFSWWAAWVGEQQNRPTVHPTPWINKSKMNYEDFFLPQWIGIDRD